MNIISHPNEFTISSYAWSKHNLSYHGRLVVACTIDKSIPSIVDIHLNNFPNASTDDLFLDIIKLIPDREYLLIYTKAQMLILYTQEGHRYEGLRIG